MARKQKKPPFVITIFAASAVSSLVACGGSTANDSGSGSGGTSSGGTSSGGTSSGGTSSGGTSSGGTSSGGTGGSNPGCPTTFPEHGTSCSLPNGTSCTFSQGECCPSWESKCVNGLWEGYQSTCNPPPPPPCPDAPPENGDACGLGDPCGFGNQYCTYGTCADGSSATTAECNGTTWNVTQNPSCVLPACETLSACECFDRADCGALSEGCLCECDFSCPGKPPCVCACGGGNFLGCVSKLD